MEPIAIIGMSFRLPQGVEDEPSLWDTLEKGKNLVTDWPSSRANVDAFFENQAASNGTVFHNGYIKMMNYFFPNSVHSYDQRGHIFSARILLPLMLHFSPSPQRKPLQWIHSSVYYWKQHIMHLRMVC